MCGKYQISSGYTIISETTIDIYMCEKYSSLGGEKCHKYIAFPFCKSKTHLTVHFHFPLCMSKPHLYMSLLHVYVKTSFVCHYFMCMSKPHVYVTTSCVCQTCCCESVTCNPITSSECHVIRMRFYAPAFTRTVRCCFFLLAPPEPNLFLQPKS